MQWMFLFILAVAGGSLISHVSSSASPPSSKLLISRPLTSPVPQEVYYDTAQLIKSWGYPVEKHIVVTEDGYKIGVFRIPGSQKSPKRFQKPVVYLQHGLIQSSDQWVIRGPQEDLVFQLADRGYDIWMGNVRGNQYALSHIKMTVRDNAFWKYSWHENGYYDVAAGIKYALSVAKVPNLLYIGHSMGTSTAMVLLSERPEFNQLVRAAFLLAPVGPFTNPKGLLAPFLGLSRILEAQFRRIDFHAPFLPRTSTFSKFLYNLCAPPKNDICLGFYYTGAGHSPDQVNQTAFPTLMAHMPAGSSIGQFRHYVQSYVFGDLRHFDHGTRENTRMYGSAKPPPYRLDRITAPILLFYSKGDYLASDSDALVLAKWLPNVQALEKTPLESFNHGDYLWGIDTYRLLYKKLYSYMEKY